MECLGESPLPLIPAVELYQWKQHHSHTRLPDILPPIITGPAHHPALQLHLDHSSSLVQWPVKVALLQTASQ